MVENDAPVLTDSMSNAIRRAVEVNGRDGLVAIRLTPVYYAARPQPEGVGPACVEIAPSPTLAEITDGLRAAVDPRRRDILWSVRVQPIHSGRPHRSVSRDVDATIVQFYLEPGPVHGGWCAHWEPRRLARAVDVGTVSFDVGLNSPPPASP